MNSSAPRVVLLGVIFATVLLGAAIQIGLLWYSTVPLGVPGEWVWLRLEPTLPLLAMIWPAILMGVVLASYVSLNALNFNYYQRRTRAVLLLGLWGIGIVWTLSLIASTPGIAGLSRIPFVLFYTRSSGYFTQAYENRNDVQSFLRGYRDRIEDSNNPENHLHLGTHPPGLTLGIMGMMWASDNVPGVSALFTLTQPSQVRESNEAIREFEAISGKPITLKQNEAAVLWMIGLLTVVMAAGASPALYLLARRFVDPSTAWWSAGFWLAVPAVAIFVPKSDVLFAGLAMAAQLLWLKALDRNRFPLGLLTGLVMCLALTFSLAFAPIALIFVLQGVLTTIFPASSENRNTLLLHRWKPPVGAIVALVGWLLIWALIWKVNLIGIWIQNLTNHAAFYAHNVRTYWAWLVENPLELAFSIGCPLAVLVLFGLWCALTRRTPQILELLIPVAVWMVLWISGKNMGEAARLWVFLMPYTVWCAAIGIQRLNQSRTGWQALSLFFVVQLVVTVATAIRIDGFGFSELQP